jgi:hypothetical protein
MNLTVVFSEKRNRQKPLILKQRFSLKIIFNNKELMKRMSQTHLLKFLSLLLFLSAFVMQVAAQGKTKPLVVFVTGDHEYSSETTMPLLARALEKNYGMRTVVLKSSPDQNAEENIPGLEILKKADLAVFFLRWRRLPADQVKYIEEYLQSGKPVVGFRTSTHAFNYPKDHVLAKWNAFGEFALGSPPGWGGKADHTHCGHTCSTDVSVIPESAAHPILKGVDSSFHVRSWLYKVLPDYPAKDATWLLMGKAAILKSLGLWLTLLPGHGKHLPEEECLPPPWATRKTLAWKPFSAW